MNSIIYIKLLGEGTKTWRPTIGSKLENGLYKVQETDNYDSLDENWEFKPGSVVKCEVRSLSNEQCLIAVKKAE